MPDRLLYEYAVIRVVPVLQREEFINVGVIVLCQPANALHVRVRLDEQRLAPWHDVLDMAQVRANLLAFERIAAGRPEGGPIAAYDAASRFRWLTAVRSSAIQTSRPHPGLTNDLEGTVERLFTELVL
ncbi:MAG: DUF3037 domain-containing protein [Flavobacteriales bacterium]|jgi:hypothetical protein|nr:DUF3037 domain-containing protein [Flavobacteriales bacterium]